MTDNVRNYPDIHFVDTDTETLVNELIRSYEEYTGRTLYPADPMRVVILWMASAMIQERVNLDFSARQNVPRYAEGEFLDSLAEIFKDTYRLPPEKAKTTLRYTLSTALTSGTIIPGGTRATVDGTIIFQTMEPLAIPAGSLTGEVAAECLTAGTIGNGFVPGQINQPIDIFPYFQAVENVSESDGGADEESDAAFYERMRESMETFSTAGPKGSYEYYAKTASALISDVRATGPEDEPGVVDVRVLIQGGEMPTEEILQKVLETLNDERVRPLTDFVRVQAPDAVKFNVDLTYYVPKPSAASAEIIKQEVEKAVAEYICWQTEKMGRDINPSTLIRRVMETGAKRVEVREPAFQTVANTAVAALNKSNVIFGGVEDE